MTSATASQTPVQRPTKVGPFTASEDVGQHGPVRWLSIRRGGNPESFGDKYLAIGAAMSALHGALTVAGLGGDTGPKSAMLVLPHEEFCKLRDALVADCDAGANMFRRPRRKRVDLGRLQTMLGGITIASDRIAERIDLANPRCPHRGAA